MPDDESSSGDGGEGKKRRSSFSLDDPEKKKLFGDVGFIREMDDKVALDKLSNRVESLAAEVSRIVAKGDKDGDKLTARLDQIAERSQSNSIEFQTSISELKMDVTRLEAQVKVLMDLKESNWINNFLKLADNKQVRVAFLVIMGWAASALGPEALKALISVFTGG